MYTDHQGDLIISVAPAVPPASANQCPLPVPINATCQCPSVASSMPHISVHLSCLSVPPISASQCHLSVLPVPPISASQCHLS
ncbi:unnamed protein product, partial [Staurois parvus]